jgi:hypothetical protein
LELEKDIYGHPPPVVFERRAEKFIQQETIDVYLPDGQHQPSGASTPKKQMAHRRPKDTFLSLRPLSKKNKLRWRECRY